MIRVQQLLFAACLILIPTAIRADLIVTILPTPTVVGTDIYLNVLVYSTSSDDISAFNISYVIDKPGLQFYVDALGNPDELQFMNSSDVFYHNSLAAVSGPGGGGSVNAPANNIYVQSDAVNSEVTGHYFESVGTTDALLGTLHFVASTSGIYTISVDNSRTSGNGFFAPDFSLIDFSVASAQISVTVASVPEPSSLSLFVFGSTGLLGWAIYRRRVRDGNADSSTR